MCIFKYMLTVDQTEVYYTTLLLDVAHVSGTTTTYKSVKQGHCYAWIQMCVYCIYKCMLLFLLGLCSPECECPSETCFQTKRALTEEEGSFFRHKRWDCSEQSKCVWGRDYVYGFERVCMSVRKRLCLCVRDCLAQWVVWLCIYICVCVAETLAGKTGQAFCISVCISVWYQTFVHKMGTCSVFIPLLLVIIEAEQLTLTTALCTDTVHVSESFTRPETDFQTLWKSCLVPHESLRYHL